MGKATVPAGAGATGESFLAALFRAFSIVSSILSIGDDVSSVFFFATVARAVPSCSIMVDMATCVAVSFFAPLILRGRARKAFVQPRSEEIERTVLLDTPGCRCRRQQRHRWSET